MTMMMTTRSYPTRRRLTVMQMKLNKGREDSRYSKRKELREIRLNPLTTSHNLVLFIRIYCWFCIIPINKVKWSLTELTTRSASVGQRSVRWLKRGQPCLHHLHVLGIAFPSGHSLFLVFVSFFYPHCSPPLFFPLINQCDRCLVPLAWWFMAIGRGFTSHWGVTFSRGWLCQTWKPLDFPGTHLHLAT